MSDGVRAVWLRTAGAVNPVLHALLSGSSSFYVVDATFRRAALDDDGLLHEVLGALSYRNLDDDPDFAGTHITTEALARVIADRPALRIRDAALGRGGDRLAALAVTLDESPVASAS